MLGLQKAKTATLAMSQDWYKTHGGKEVRKDGVRLCFVMLADQNQSLMSEIIGEQSNKSEYIIISSSYLQQYLAASPKMTTRLICKTTQDITQNHLQEHRQFCYQRMLVVLSQTDNWTPVSLFVPELWSMGTSEPLRLHLTWSASGDARSHCSSLCHDLGSYFASSLFLSS